MSKATIAPLLLSRVTTRYVAAEDRILMVGERADRDVIELWLPWRLLSRLVPRLCGQLDPFEADGAQSRVSSDAAHTMAQQAAMLGLRPQAPVQRSGVAPTAADPVEQDRGLSGEAPAPVRLVRTINVHQTGTSTVLCFREHADSRVVAALALEPRPLRQWLGILARQCGDAQWSMAGWPRWLQDAAQQPPAPHAVH